MTTKLAILSLLSATFLSTGAFAEVTVSDHLSSQEAIDDEAYDINNAKRARFFRLSREIREALGLSRIFCPEPEESQTCQKGISSLHSLMNDSRIKAKGFTKIVVGDRFGDAEISYGNYSVTIDGKASAQDILKYLLQMKKVSREDLNSNNRLRERYFSTSNEVKESLGLSRIFCPKPEESQTCQKGISTLHGLKNDPRIKAKGFTKVVIGNRFSDAGISYGNYSVTVDGNASEEQIIEFLNSQPVIDEEAYDINNAKRAGYFRLSREARSDMGLSRIFCPSPEEYRVCQKGISSLHALRNDPRIKAKGFTKIVIGSKFEEAEVSYGNYTVTIDGNAPTGEIVEYLNNQQR